MPRLNRTVILSLAKDLQFFCFYTTTLDAPSSPRFCFCG